MPQPTELGEVHVDRALGDLSLRFSQSADKFIARKVFPVIPVNFRSDKFFTYTRDAWYRTDAEKRAPGTESAGSGYALSTDNYFCDVYALHKDIDDQLRANADSPIALDSDATEFVTQHMLQKLEQDFVSAYFTTGVWTTDKTGSTHFTQWDDASSTPVEDIRAGITAMAKLTGYRPNTLILGPETWNEGLVDHPDLLDRVKYSQKGVVGTDLLASLLDIDRVLIPWSIKNTSAEGVTASYSFNWGKNALLLYVPPRAGLNVAAPGYTFVWKGLLGSNADGIRIKRFRIEQIAADRVEAEMAYDLKKTSADLGYFFSAAVA